MTLPVKALVKNGRLTVDEPSDLPEGQVVYLEPVEGLVPEIEEQRDDGDRVALHAELEASIADAESGQTEDFAKVIGELREVATERPRTLPPSGVDSRDVSGRMRGREMR